MISNNPLTKRLKEVFPNSIKHHAKKAIIGVNALTSSFRLPPSFIVAGIQKGGTTSLYNYLCQHPQISPILQKEIHFFDRHYDKGINWYLGNFPLKIAMRNQSIVGEATPTYLYSRNTAERIKKHFPNIKIILVLRNPVERAYSDFNYGVKLGFHKSHEFFTERMRNEIKWLNENIEILLDGKDHYELVRNNCSYLGPGLYNIWIKYWMELFGDNLYVIGSEDFFENTTDSVNALFDFLGLYKYDIAGNKAYNSNDYLSISKEDKDALCNFYYEHIREFEGVLNKKMNWLV